MVATLAIGCGLMTVQPSAAATSLIRAPGDQLWVSRYQGPTRGGNGVADMALSPDGRTVYVTGSSQGRLSGSDFATVMYDSSTGDRIGVLRYNGPDNYSDWATSLAISQDGMRLYVAGTS